MTRIIENLNMMNKAFTNDPYAKSFDISVLGRMLQISGRVLDPPILGYKKSKLNLSIPINFPCS